MDFDHDYDPDLFLLGDDSKLMRNNGEAGFSDETKRFPFVAGRAVAAQRTEVEPDTPGFDLVISYDGHPPVLYRDKLGGVYEASAAQASLARVRLSLADFAGNGRPDRAVISERRPRPPARRQPQLRQLDRNRAHRRQERQTRARRQSRSEGREPLRDGDLSRRAAGLPPGRSHRSRHRPHHLAQRPDPERNPAAHQPPHGASKKRRASPAPAP